MKKTPFVLSAAFTLALLLPAPRAHAISTKDAVLQLQTQVQQLQDQIQHLQDSQAASMAVLQHTVQTTSDNVSKLTLLINGLQQQISNESQNANSQVSGQIQNLNDSVDEVKTRLNQINKTLQSLQSQLQNIQAQPAGGQTPACPPGQTGPDGQPCPTQPAATGQPSAPPAPQLYQSAVSDYNGAHYNVAAGEFQQLLQAYPQDKLAPSAYFYLGQIAFHQGDYNDAVNNYQQVLDQYGGSSQAPSAQLRKGEAELRAHKREDAIRDFRELISRYPRSPEASQARSHLNAMGVRIVPRGKPSAYR
jgi:tol-pal system protein YbgF